MTLQFYLFFTLPSLIVLNAVFWLVRKTKIKLFLYLVMNILCLIPVFNIIFSLLMSAFFIAVDFELSDRIVNFFNKKI